MSEKMPELEVGDVISHYGGVRGWAFAGGSSPEHMHFYGALEVVVAANGNSPPQYALRANIEIPMMCTREELPQGLRIRRNGILIWPVPEPSVHELVCDEVAHWVHKTPLADPGDIADALCNRFNITKKGGPPPRSLEVLE